MTDDLTRPGNLQLAQASGEGDTNQDIVAVTQPPNGGETILPSLANRVYDLRFDPRLAQVRVVDADGDGDLDVVLLFNAGTPEQSRIVFVDMVEATQSGLAPALQVGEQKFGADVVVRQAQTLAGEQPTLETTATAGPEAVGTGATQYDDNLGALIDLLNAQDVIPGVEMAFPSIDPEETGEGEDSTPATGTIIGDDPGDGDDPGTGDVPEASIVGAPSVAEGAFAEFTIQLSDQSAFDSMLNVTASDSGSGIGFATGGTGEPADYLNTTLEFFDGTNWVPFANGTSVTVPAGTTSLQVRVTTLDDAGNPIFEGPEAFEIALSDAGDPNVTVDTTPATGTINDDDSGNGDDPGTGDVPDVTIGDASADEGDRLVFTVTLSNPSFEAVTLALSTAGSGDNPATDGVDYENVNFEVSTNGVDWVAAGGADATEITFAPAATLLFVRIDSFIDDLNEMDETFTLSATATAGTIGTVTNGTGTIIDTTPILVVGTNADDAGTTGPTHTVPNPIPGAPDQGAIIGGDGADILIGDPGGALFDDLNVAIILDISSSMVNPDNNPAPGVTRLDVVQDALEKILPQLASRDSVVNLFIETFSTDADDPLFIGELTTANVDEIIADIFDLDGEAGGFTNYEAPLTDMQDWYLDQIAATEGFSNVAYFLTDGFPNRWLDDDGNVAGAGGPLPFNPIALSEAIAAIPNVLDRDSGTLSGDDEVLLNAIGASNALESTLDLLDNTEVIDPGPPQVGEAQIVNLGDPSAVPDEFLVVGFGVGADEISGRDGDDIIFGDVPNSDALATDEGIDLPPGSGWFVFEALEAGQSPSIPGWDRSDTIAYLGDPANQPNLIGAGRGEGDTIDGGAGDDVIFGQGGDDSLTGGPGADTFVFTLAADEGDDEILDFSTAEGDLLSFVNVTDADASSTLGIEDVVDSFVDGGGAGAVDTLVLESGTTIMITDLNGTLNDLASLEANSLINAAMA